MPKKYLIPLFVLIVLFSNGCAHIDKKSKTTAYQYSNLSAFLSGGYDGELNVGELKRHGNFGIGTFNGMDGELILLKGVCYQAGVDGKVSRAGNRKKVPFAVVDFFRPSAKAALYKTLTYKELTEYLDLLIPAGNSIFAINIEGEFGAIKIRSFARQDKPYQPFSEVEKNQSVLELNNIKGTLVGFYFPDYMKEINVSGYHFHFISRDKKSGGQLLDCNLLKGNIKIQKLNNFLMSIPDNKEFSEGAGQ